MLTIFVYNKKELREINNNEIKSATNKEKNQIWIKVSKPSDEEIEILKENFNLHPTTVEDVLSHQTRVKYEEFEDYTFIIFKTIKGIKDNYVETCNTSFIVGENFLLTFNGDGNEIAEELSRNKKRMESLLKKGKEYIAHYILDKEVDKYLKIKTELGEDLKQMEREFMENQGKGNLTKIFSKELTFLELRQLSESMTDLCLDLTKPADNYINNDLIPYFRDIYDHTFKTTEGYKTMLGRMNGMKNMYASMAQIKTNETMKVLTILMAIMMPLTIITGFFGMNIHLPLEDHPDAYLFILGLMIFSGIFLVWMSINKGWMSK